MRTSLTNTYQDVIVVIEGFGQRQGGAVSGVALRQLFFGSLEAHILRALQAGQLQHEKQFVSGLPLTDLVTEAQA